MISINRSNVAVLVIASAFIGSPLPARSQTPNGHDNALARFPVAHEHISGWCLGYVYLYVGSISYEVTWPAGDHGHSFELGLSNLQVGRWVASGQQMRAMELKTATSTYHFWWLANE